MKSATFDRSAAIRARDRLKLKQRQVARTVGCSRGMYSMIESGHRQPSAELYEAICLALGLTPWQDLLIESDQPEEAA